MEINIVETGPKWRHRSAARPDEILDAALELFIEKGFAATRVEDIARAAGLSKGAVYLYFKSKEAVFEGLVQRGIVPIIENVEQMAREITGDPQFALRTLVTLISQRMSDPRLSAIPRLVVAEAGQFPELAQMYRAEVIDRGLSALETLLRRGIDAGTFRFVNPRHALRSVMGPMITHLLLANVFGVGDGPEQDAGHFAKSHLDILFNGLLAETEG